MTHSRVDAIIPRPPSGPYLFPAGEQKCDFRSEVLVKLNILSDADWASRLDHVLRHFSATGYRKFFEEREYGRGLREVVVILMARDPQLKFRRRIRFDKQRRLLSFDIMLDLDELSRSSDSGRIKLVVDRLASEIPDIVQKYVMENFDQVRFLDDVKHWLVTIAM